MKTVFFLLLLANVGFFAWTYAGERRLFSEAQPVEQHRRDRGDDHDDGEIAQKVLAHDQAAGSKRVRSVARRPGGVAPARPSGFTADRVVKSSIRTHPVRLIANPWALRPRAAHGRKRGEC